MTVSTLRTSGTASETIVIGDASITTRSWVCVSDAMSSAIR